jgi:hypothetical protein
MIRRPSKPHRNLIPYAALLLVLVVGAGGGYAFASSKNKTIAVCADKKTGVLHLKTRGRCKRSQTRVTWNQQGPQGRPGPQGVAGPQGGQGPQGLQGAQGPAAVSIWANVEDNGMVLVGEGVSVQHLGAGKYQVTITAQACAQRTNAPTISVSDTEPGSLQSGVFPVAWYGSTGVNQQFMVFTGVASGNPTLTFTPSDLPFDVMDTCE